MYRGRVAYVGKPYLKLSQYNTGTGSDQGGVRRYALGRFIDWADIIKPGP